MKVPAGFLTRSPALGWALGYAVLTAALQVVSDTYGGWRFARTAYGAGEWWQLFTAQWVHFTVAHAVLNAAVMALMLLAFQGLVGASTQWLALLGGYVGVAMAIALDPHCTYYAGASGALHGFWAGNALGLLMFPTAPFQPPGRVRLLGLVLLAAMALKLGLEQHIFSLSLPSGLDFSAPVLGLVPVYYPAHMAGALGGIGAVWLGRMLIRCGSAQPPGA